MKYWKFMPFDWNVVLTLSLVYGMVVGLMYISEVELHRIILGVVANILVIIGLKLRDPDGRSLPASMMEKMSYALRGETPPTPPSGKESSIRLTVLTLSAMVVGMVVIYEMVSGATLAKAVGDVAFAAANGLIGVAVMMATPKPPVQSDEDTVSEFIRLQAPNGVVKAIAVIAIGAGAIMLAGGVAFAHDPDSVSEGDTSYGVVCSTLPGVAHGCEEDAGEVEEAQQEEESEPVEQVEVAVSDGEVLYEAQKTICIKAEANVWLRAFAEAAGIVDKGSENVEDEVEICQTFTIQVSGGGFALVTTSVK